MATRQVLLLASDISTMQVLLMVIDLLSCTTCFKAWSKADVKFIVHSGMIIHTSMLF